MTYYIQILRMIPIMGGLTGCAKAAAINMGTAGNFSVLAGSAVTNTGLTVIMEETWE